MQQFQVPQFIEMEDKLFGPLTFKQFLYLVGGAGICFILYVYLPIFISIPLIAGVAGLSIALAFAKYNGRPFIYVVESFVKYTLNNKLYVWKKDEKINTVKKSDKPQEKKQEEIIIPKLSDSKLNELAWSLDVKKEDENNY